MSSQSEELNQIEENAKNLITTLEKLKKEIESYQTASDNIDTAQESLKNTSSKLEELAKQTKILIEKTQEANIGTILSNIEALSSAFENDIKKLSKSSSDSSEEILEKIDILKDNLNDSFENVVKETKLIKYFSISCMIVSLIILIFFVYFFIIVGN